MKILIVEDEKQLCEALVELLKRNNISAEAVHTGSDGLAYAQSNIYDVIILDIMLPEMSGLEILRRLRDEKNPVPVLLLTARAEAEDKIKGLDCGADDYLTKPFIAGELLARIRALTRRKGEFVGDIITIGNISLNKNTHEISSGTRSVKLGLKEYETLELLMSNTGQIIPKERFFEKIWGFDSDVEYNNIEVYISFLRRKLSALDADIQIKAVRGLGYKLENLQGTAI